MTDAERHELQRLLGDLFAEPDTPLDPEWRRAANLLMSSRPDATARLLRRHVEALAALAAPVAAAAATGPASTSALPSPAVADAPVAASPLRQVATLAAGVGTGVVAGGLVLGGLGALLGDDADIG